MPFNTMSGCTKKVFLLLAGVCTLLIVLGVQKRKHLFSKEMFSRENEGWTNGTQSTNTTAARRSGTLAYEVSLDLNILPASARITGIRLFKTKPLVIWATEWHMTPIKDTRHFLESFGVRVIDYNLDPRRCEFHDCSAKARLNVLNPDNVLNIDPPIPEKFYEAYKDDAEMKTVDAFFCGYPASLCEMYEPFNKSVIVLASTRLFFSSRFFFINCAGLILCPSNQ